MKIYRKQCGNNLKYFIFLLLLCPNIIQAFCIPKLSDLFLTKTYVQGFGGINGGYTLQGKNAKTNRGYYAGLKAGKKIFPCFRLEEEFIWQGNNVNKIKRETSLHVDETHFNKAHGFVDVWSLMTNGVLDIPFNCGLPARPYIGGGIGWGWANGSWRAQLTQTINQKTQAFRLNQTSNAGNDAKIEKKFKRKFYKSNFAWQFLAGLNFSIYCGIVMSAEYRYYKMESSLSNHKFGLTLSKFF